MQLIQLFEEETTITFHWEQLVNEHLHIHHVISHLWPSSTTRTSQRGILLNTGVKSLVLVKVSYVVTRTWNLARRNPVSLVSCSSSNFLMMALDLASP